MKIEVNNDGDFVFKEVYNAIVLDNEEGDCFSICMRDFGFEFCYNGVWYSAQNGVIENIDDILKVVEDGMKEHKDGKTIKIDRLKDLNERKTFNVKGRVVKVTRKEPPSINVDDFIEE